MNENFITNIKVLKSKPNIENLEILLSENQRQHIIFTGKNGSGKTSLLLELNKFLTKIDNGEYNNFESQKKYLETYLKQIKSPNLRTRDFMRLEKQIANTKDWINAFGGTRISFSS